MKSLGYLVGVGVLAGLVGTCTMPHWSRDTYTVKVVGTERVVESSGKKVGSKYLAFTQDITTGQERVFENIDSWGECLWGRCKFDSSDLQAKLKAAEQNKNPVDVRAYGWRVPFMSWYQNVVEVKPKPLPPAQEQKTKGGTKP